METIPLYTRELRSMAEFVRKTLTTTGHPGVSDAVITHIALLVMALQTMSEIITFMIGDAHPFYTHERNMGLDASTLCQPVDAGALADALRPENQTHAFWHSPTLEQTYWGLMLRCMLGADEETWRHPLAAQVVALSIRFRMVGPVAKRLLGLVRDVVAKCDLKSNDLMTSVRLRLLALLRQPAADQPEVDIDPTNAIPRGLHNRQFAGAVDRLPPAIRREFKDIGSRMERRYGKAAAGAVLAAAELAGLRVDAAYAGAEEVAADAASKTPLRANMDCGAMLSTQRPLLQRLDDILHYLDADDETRAYDRVLRKTDLAVEDIFFNLLNAAPEDEEED
jgi:hypothetical protein